MKKDIDFLKVEDITIAIVPDNNDVNAENWEVFLVNQKKESIRNVLVNSKGYGEIDGEKKETSTFRHFIEEVAPESFLKVEIMRDDVLSLANEYWVSFSLNDYLFDKRFIFVQGSLADENLTMIPLVNKRGVMIR